MQLLGRSERDDAVRALLSEIKVQQPLKRPPRGVDQVNIELSDEPVELCFVEADSLPARNDDLMEGELILDTVFLHGQPEKDDSADALPLGLSMNLSRAELRKKLGQPSWSSPMLNNDRWVIGDMCVLVCFSEERRQ